MNPLNPRLFIASAAAALLPAKARTQTGPAMRLRCRCADQEFSYLLRDNATSRDLNLPGRIEGGVAPLRVRSLHPLRPDHMS